MKMKKITTRKAWTHNDNRELVNLYNLFLSYQEQGVKYQKAKPVRELAAKQERSKGSIECKLMNVSAIRELMGLPLVAGYKSLSNYNKDLVDAVKESL
jgi:hypothetical protein